MASIWERIIERRERKRAIKDVMRRREEEMRYSTSFSGKPPEAVIEDTIAQVRMTEEQARAERQERLEHQVQLENDRILREQTENQINMAAMRANEDFMQNNH